jgi:hypothetical protein
MQDRAGGTGVVARFLSRRGFGGGMGIRKNPILTFKIDEL